MLLDPLIRLIVITITSLFALTSAHVLASAQQINGDCNIVNPNSNNRNNVSYEIKCNNISNIASDQIERILNIIQEQSKRNSNQEFEQLLSILLRDSKSTLAELHRSKSPFIELSTRKIRDCERCYTDVDFTNIGGDIQRIESFSLKEIVSVGLNFYDSTCPFRKFSPSESNWITMDHSDAGFSTTTRTNLTKGEAIARIEFSGRMRRNDFFERRIIEIYNKQRKYEFGSEFDAKKLRSCIDVEYVLPIRIVLVNYSGSKYEQHFILNYNDGNIEDVPFDRNENGYKRYADLYDKALKSRQMTESVSLENVGMIVNFMIDNIKK